MCKLQRPVTYEAVAPDADGDTADATVAALVGFEFMVVWVMVIEVSLPASEGRLWALCKRRQHAVRKRVMPSVAATETASAAKKSISVSNIFFGSLESSAAAKS